MPSGSGTKIWWMRPPGTTFSRKLRPWRAQGGAGRLQVQPAKGDVIERRSVARAVRTVARLGLRRVDQMHDRHAAEVEPVTLEGKFRPVAHRKAEHVAIEIARALQAGAADRVVLEHFDGHGWSFP